MLNQTIPCYEFLFASLARGRKISFNATAFPRFFRGHLCNVLSCCTGLCLLFLFIKPSSASLAICIHLPTYLPCELGHSLQLASQREGERERMNRQGPVSSTVKKLCL
jgi:hypothetical protein